MSFDFEGHYIIFVRTNMFIRERVGKFKSKYSNVTEYDRAIRLLRKITVLRKHSASCTGLSLYTEHCKPYLHNSDIIG